MFAEKDQLLKDNRLHARIVAPKIFVSPYDSLCLFIFYRKKENTQHIKEEMKRELTFPSINPETDLQILPFSCRCFTLACKFQLARDKILATCSETLLYSWRNPRINGLKCIELSRLFLAKTVSEPMKKI